MPAALRPPIQKSRLDKADWIMSSETVGDFKMKVMQEALPRMANIPEFLELDGSAEFLELCKKAAPQIATLNELAGKNGKSLCHGDARTENCLWPNQRKDPLVLIDWQFVSYAHVCSDLCYFIAVCLTPEEQDKYGDSLIRFYYDTLTSSPGGPSTSEYTWEAFQLDYKREMWVSCWVSCMGVSNIQCISDEAEKHKGEHRRMVLQALLSCSSCPHSAAPSNCRIAPRQANQNANVECSVGST